MEPIVSSSTAIVLQQALLSEDIDRFQNELQKFIISAVSYNDASTEGFYPGFLTEVKAASAKLTDNADIEKCREK